MTTRKIGGMTLVAVSPSHYRWKVDQKLEFKYDGAMWWIVMPGRGKQFRTLLEAIRFCLLQINPGKGVA